MPAARASRPASMWSIPPADPPAQLTRSGSARKSRIRSARVSWGEPAGTATTSYSSSSRASGTVSSIESGVRLVRMAPSMTCPKTISVCGSPRATKSASPMVPPAPPRLTTSTGTPRMPASVHTCWIWRAVWSQPPPGLAGARRVTAPRGYPAAVGSSASGGRSGATPPAQPASNTTQTATAQKRNGGPGPGSLRRHAVTRPCGMSALYQDRRPSTSPNRPAPASGPWPRPAGQGLNARGRRTQDPLGSGESQETPAANRCVP